MIRITSRIEFRVVVCPSACPCNHSLSKNICSHVHIFPGGQRRLVLQIGAIGLTPRPQNVVKRKPINTINLATISKKFSKNY